MSRWYDDEKRAARDVDIVRLYSDGLSSIVLGARFGIADSSVRKVLRKNNVRIREARRPKLYPDRVAYRELIRIRTREWSRQSYHRNRQKVKDKSRARQMADRKRTREIGRKSELKHRDKRLSAQRARQTSIEGRAKANAYSEIYYARTCPRIARNLRSRLRDHVKRAAVGSKCNLFGCSIEMLRQHLERQFKPGMTWDNYGYNGWHIDRILPLSSFYLTHPYQRNLAFHYTNLQPLWKLHNLSKGNRIQTTQLSLII